MCGICGIIDFEGAIVRRETIEEMADSLWHRGPDEAGYHFEPAVGLGHRRLSIIDLSTGQQPLSNEDGSVWVVFNGEIYNYLELRSRLQSKGHQFRTNSDTEVIVHLYEEVGEECFSQLRGMFAIALWDRRRKQAILARDRIGKKPLFYSHQSSRLVFGSELKAIAAGGEANLDLDVTAVADYFTFLYIPAPKSIYRNVRKVPAAHYIVFSEEGARQHCYWDLRFNEVESRSEGEWCEAVREALMEAVRVRLMSEVPLGSFLSGGMDSSIVVACMARLLDRPVAACSIGFEEERYSEVQHAQRVAQHLAADYHQTMVHPNATQIVELLAWHYDEPFGDSSAVPTYYVSKAARERVTVALTGDGGDESFGGYKRYLHDLEDNRVQAMVPSSLRKIARPLSRWYPPLERAPRIFRGKSFLQRLAQDPMERYLSRITVEESVRQSLLSNDVKEQLHGYDPLEQFREHYRRADTSDTLSRLQYLDIKTYLTDDICVKLDRASMAVSLEARCPLLDDRLMELAARIPSHLKVRNGSGKYILKRATEPMFPPKFLERPKQGFGVPIAEWFRGELREWAQNVMFESDELLNVPYLRHIWNRHQNGIQDHSAILWGVCMFRQWQKTFRRQPKTSRGCVNAFTQA
jgi:asparagine synthase (glutamine-hydrolysing)